MKRAGERQRALCASHDRVAFASRPHEPGAAQNFPAPGRRLTAALPLSWILTVCRPPPAG